jgi:hypothetical protein
MRAAFPEVPADGLATAGREVSLLVGQDNLGLFPSERRRIVNAADSGQDGLPPEGLRWPGAVEVADTWEYASRCDRAGHGGTSKPARPGTGGPGDMRGVHVVAPLDGHPPAHRGGYIPAIGLPVGRGRGNGHTAGCASCLKCKECKFRADSLSSKENQEYQVILDGLKFDEARAKLTAIVPIPHSAVRPPGQLCPGVRVHPGARKEAGQARAD